MQGGRHGHVLDGRHDGQRAAPVAVRRHVHGLGEVPARHVRHDVAGHDPVRAERQRVVPVGRRLARIGEAGRRRPVAAGRRVLQLQTIRRRQGTAADHVPGRPILTPVRGQLTSRRPILLRTRHNNNNNNNVMISPILESKQRDSSLFVRRVTQRKQKVFSKKLFSTHQLSWSP